MEEMALVFRTGQHGWRRAGLSVALAVAIVGCTLTPGSVAVRAAAPQARPLAQKTTVCAWPRGSIGPQRFGNFGYIDSNSLYLLMTFARLPGLSLRVRGRFPNARFMSFTANAGRGGAVIDHLADKDIVPDRGSTNPFLLNANRKATHRSYTISIVQGNPPASGRAKNTLYTGPYHPVTLIYRVYAPDAGADPYGNSGKPQVQYISNLPGTKGQTRVIPACSPLAAVRGSQSALSPTTMQWRRTPGHQRWKKLATSGGCRPVAGVPNSIQLRSNKCIFSSPTCWPERASNRSARRIKPARTTRATIMLTGSSRSG